MSKVQDDARATARLRAFASPGGGRGARPEIELAAARVGTWKASERLAIPFSTVRDSGRSGCCSEWRRIAPGNVRSVWSGAGIRTRGLTVPNRIGTLSDRLVYSLQDKGLNTERGSISPSVPRQNHRSPGISSQNALSPAVGRAGSALTAGLGRGKPARLGQLRSCGVCQILRQTRRTRGCGIEGAPG
jgi:hypothetical protein